MKVVLTSEQVEKIKALRQEIADKLNQSLEGVADTRQEGEIKNKLAPCLIAHSLDNLTRILAVINEAEKMKGDNA